MNPVPESTPPPLLPPTLESAAADTPKKSELGRLIGVFVSPGEAFKDIARRPHWWAPVLISAVVTTAYLYAISERIGWEEVIRAQLDRSPAGRNIPAGQRQAIIATQMRIIPYITYGGGLLGSLLNVVIVAGVLKFLADVILGAGIGFKRMMGIVAYGFLPYTVMAGLSMAVLYMTPPDEFDMENPLMFNLGVLVEDPGALKALATSVDLFSFWTMLMLSIGMAAASRKMSTGKAFGMLLFPWALIVILRAGVAALFT